jgi:hypothetical protein
MHRAIKVTLTSICILTVAWPLLFWGKPATPGQRNAETQVNQELYNVAWPREPQRELLW